MSLEVILEIETAYSEVSEVFVKKLCKEKLQKRVISKYFKLIGHQGLCCLFLNKPVSVKIFLACGQCKNRPPVGCGLWAL